MKKKAIGTLLGFAASLVGVILWIVLGMFGYIAGIAGAATGILFVLVYKKFTGNTSIYCYIMSCVVMVIDIVVAELIFIAAYANSVGYTFSYVISLGEIQSSFFMDIAIGIVLSSLVLGVYLFRERNQIKMQKKQAALAEQQVAAQAQQEEVFATDTSSNINELTEEKDSNVEMSNTQDGKE